MTRSTARAFGPILARSEEPALGLEHERELLVAARGGDRAAQARLVGAHLRLVRAVAGRVTRCASEDALAEGIVGLLEAIPRFEPARECRFSTYAAYWIRSRVQRFVLANRQIVAAPDTRAARRVFARLGQAERKLATREANPDRADLARELGVPVRELENVLTSLRTGDVPLDTTEEVSPTGTSSGEPGPEERVADAELVAVRRRVIDAVVERLPARERRVVQERSLLVDGASLQQLATELDLSRERVRQLEVQALRRIGDALSAQGLGM